jgi:hypothetical protein
MPVTTRSQAKASLMETVVKDLSDLVQPFTYYSKRFCAKKNRLLYAINLFQYVKDNFSNVCVFFRVRRNLCLNLYNKVDELEASISSVRYFNDIPFDDHALVRRHIKRLSYLMQWCKNKMDAEELLSN